MRRLGLILQDVAKANTECHICIRVIDALLPTAITFEFGYNYIDPSRLFIHLHICCVVIPCCAD